MEEKIEINLSIKLLERMDKLRELLGYKNRGAFMIAAVRRLLDQYTVLTSEIHQRT